MRTLTPEDDEIMSLLGPRAAESCRRRDEQDHTIMAGLSRWSACRRALQQDGPFIKAFIEEYRGYMEPMSDEAFWRLAWGDDAEKMTRTPGKTPYGRYSYTEDPQLFSMDGLFIAREPMEITAPFRGKLRVRRMTGWSVYAGISIAGTRDDPPDYDEVRLLGPVPSLRQAFLWMFHEQETRDINQRIEDTALFVDSELDKAMIEEATRRGVL
jgi:hypothetical protein